MTKAYYLGIDLGGTNIKAGLFDDQLKLVTKQRTPTHEENGPQAVLTRIYQACHDLVTAANVDWASVVALGLGVPGQMDVKAGLSIFSPNFTDWENVPVADILSKQLGKPVFIDNDVRVALYGEAAFGAAKQAKDVVLVTLGTGLGAAVMLNGKVAYGASDSVGELGHMNMYRHGGRPCACGSSGCLGRYVSGRGLVKTMQEKLAAGQPSIISDWLNDGQELTAALISDAVAKGDATAQEVFKETGELFGFGLVNVVNLLNPELIILGGGVAEAGEPLFKYTKQVIHDRAIAVAKKAVHLKLAELGPAAGMYGAAVYAKKRQSTEEKI